MAVKDKVASWFIQKFVMSNSQVLNKPGFVDMHITGGTNSIFLRESIMPESFFANAENEMVRREGERGKQLLYSAGKKFGYRYTLSGGFPTKKTSSATNFRNFVYLLIRYTEGTYANEISHEVCLENDEIDLKLKSYVICNKSGHGYFLTSGGAAGIWGKLVSNVGVEGVQVKCEGKNKSHCELIVAPAKILEKKKLKFYKETKLDGLELDGKYAPINVARSTHYSKCSFQQLLDSKIFSYNKGIIEKKGERFFLCELSGLYFFEEAFQQTSWGEEVLFNIAFELGKTLIKDKSRQKISFVMDILSALGWGDVLILKKSGKYVVTSSYFPWTKFAEGSKFIFFNGFVSGLLSSCEGRKVVFKVKSRLLSNTFSLTLSE